MPRVNNGFHFLCVPEYETELANSAKFSTFEEAVERAHWYATQRWSSRVYEIVDRGGIEVPGSSSGGYRGRFYP